eukprot:2160576-Prymnesium_polylepis.1
MCYVRSRGTRHNKGGPALTTRANVPRPSLDQFDELELHILLHLLVVVLDRRGRFGGFDDHAIEPV